MRIMKISHTLNLISQCWQQAEENLQEKIRKYSPGKGEEAITENFHEIFAETLDKVSQDKKIEKAFSLDLERAFPTVQSYLIDKISKGLIASTILHKRKTEERTGGDIGLIIARPSIEETFGSLKVNHNYRRGLLCQAKLKNSVGKWGKLTPKQIDVLPNSLTYSGLLLYEYEDVSRRELKSFQWQLCREASSINKVANWLKIGVFPSILSSEKIIKDLGDDKIGTNEKEVLDKIIAPKGNRSLEIIIKWDNPSKGPDSEVRVFSVGNIETTIEQKIYIR